MLGQDFQDRRTVKQTGGRADRQMLRQDIWDRQRDKQTGGQAGGQVESHLGRTFRTDERTNKQADN